MRNARQWLNEKYPLNQREQVEEIDNSYGEELKDSLIIENFPSLKKISLLSNKGITKLVICDCPLVKEIDASNNRLTTLEISELTNLEYLHVGNNQLRELNLEQNTKLKTLICFGNPQLKKENVEGLENLTELKLLDCDESLRPIASLREVYEERLEESRIEKEQQTEEKAGISKWDRIKTSIEREENINRLVDGGYWDKKIQTLQDSRLPCDKKQITLQTRRRNHYFQLNKVKISPEPLQVKSRVVQYAYGTPGSSNI